MPRSCRLRRFSRPQTLQAISPPLLRAFLAPYRDFLAGRGVEVEEEIDPEALAAVFLEPGPDTPDPLLDALFFVDELALPELFDDLLARAQEAKLELPDSDTMSPADLAVRVWLADPVVLERLHAERDLVRPRTFRSYLSTTPALPPLPTIHPEQITALEADLNLWFETHKRGRGTRVFPFLRDEGLWLLVRHGEPYRREGALEDERPKRIFFRPEAFDVLLYHPELGELAIHAETQGQRQAYARLIGHHLFGDGNLFADDQSEGKYTLRPIVTHGDRCLTCKDVPGIIGAQLTELQFRHRGLFGHLEIHRAADVFAAMRQAHREVPIASTLLRATFRIKFIDGGRPRRVVIRPPNVAIFDRDSDGETVHDWLGRRGFLHPLGNRYHGDTTAPLDVA